MIRHSVMSSTSRNTSCSINTRPKGARLLVRSVEAKGVRVLLNARTQAIAGGRAARVVHLADGRSLACGAVIMAVGIRPATAERVSA